MDADFRELAAGQADVVTAWQLLAADWTREMIRHRVRKHGWRVIYPGVYVLTSAPLTQRQRWMTASLTTPTTWLGHGSAGACWGFRQFDSSYETVVRPGRGGPRWLGRLLVSRSTTLEDET